MSRQPHTNVAVWIMNSARLNCRLFVDEHRIVRGIIRPNMHLSDDSAVVSRENVREHREGKASTVLGIDCVKDRACKVSSHRKRVRHRVCFDCEVIRKPHWTRIGCTIRRQQRRRPVRTRTEALGECLSVKASE